MESSEGHVHVWEFHPQAGQVCNGCGHVQDERDHFELLYNVYEVAKQIVEVSPSGTPMTLVAAVCAMNRRRKIREGTNVPEGERETDFKIDFAKYPKLASVFERRPRVNLYWEELRQLLREARAEAIRFIEDAKSEELKKAFDRGVAEANEKTF